MDNDNSKPYLNLLFLKRLREGDQDGEEGEGQFGLVPPTVDPNSVLSTMSKHTTSEQALAMKQHPLLSNNAQFSGIDPRLTANPVESESAKENYPQLRLQQQLRQQHKKRKAPTLVR